MSKSEDWIPTLKHYPHFDAPIPYRKILKLVKSPKSVAQNSFFPFLLYYDVKKKFGRKKPKKRPIRYAARRDSYIYSYYRFLLSQKYEELLIKNGLSENIIAYRKINVSKEKDSGKCNIHFAKDAFQTIKDKENCYAVALDIKDYFNKIDHERLKEIWHELMDFEEFPPDHEAIYKNITQYKFVDFDTVCSLLDYKGLVTIDGIQKFGFKKNIAREDFFKKKEYKQLCSMKYFRKKIVPKIEKNEFPYGIPQGSPISDLLANLYLLKFDKVLKEYCDKHNTTYRRYSDDILFISPPDENLLNDLISLTRKELNNAGSELFISDKKTIIKKFTSENGELKCSPYISKNTPKKDQHKGSNFEYLGFSYDGKTARIKDNTIHRYNTKMLFSCKRYARELSARYKDKSSERIMKLAKFELFYQTYGNIEDFRITDFSQAQNKRKLTFVAYAKKSAKVFSSFDNEILNQIKGHKQKLRTLLNDEIIKIKDKPKKIAA